MVVSSNRDARSQEVYRDNTAETVAGVAALGGLGALAWAIASKGKSVGKMATKAASAPEKSAIKEAISAKPKAQEGAPTIYPNGQQGAVDQFVKQAQAQVDPVQEGIDKLKRVQQLKGPNGAVSENEIRDLNLPFSSPKKLDLRPKDASGNPINTSDAFEKARQSVKKNDPMVKAALEAERKAQEALVKKQRELKRGKYTSPQKPKNEPIPEPKPKSKFEKGDEGISDYHEELFRERRERARKELHDYGSRDAKRLERDKREYDQYVDNWLSGGRHELDNDELVPIIHGGNSSQIDAFLRGDHGYHTLQDMPHHDGQFVSKDGIMVHSMYPDRAQMYANRSGGYSKENPGESAILMGYVPRKYMYENDIADEFSIPTWHSDKIVNPQVIKKSDPMYDAYQDAYKTYQQTGQQNWQKIKDNVWNSNIQGSGFTYGQAAEAMGKKYNEIDARQLGDFKLGVDADYIDKRGIFDVGNTTTTKL